MRIFQVDRQRNRLKQRIDEIQVFLDLPGCLTARRVVGEAPGQADDLAVIVYLKLRVDIDPAIAAILCDIAHLMPGKRIGAFHHVDEAGAGQFLVVQMDVIDEIFADRFAYGESCDVGPGRIQEGPYSFLVGSENDFIEAVDHIAILTFARGDFLRHALASGNVGANRNVLIGNAALVKKRYDGCIDPIVLPLLVGIANFSMPDNTCGDLLPHHLENFAGMVARIDDSVVFPDQFFACETADLAKLVIYGENISTRVGDADDRVLIHRKTLIDQFDASLLLLHDEIRQQSRQSFEIFLCR